MFSWIVRVFVLFPLLFSISCSSFSKERITWKTLADGLSETSWTTHDSNGSSISLQLYKIEPKKFRFQVFQAKDYQTEGIRIKDLLSRTGGVLAVNASFFDSNYKPLGLVLREGKVLNPLRSVSWWAVFSIDSQKGPQITPSRDFQIIPNIEMAVQTGPRLVKDGVPIPVKPNISEKTFIGISQEGEVILGVTESCIMDATDLARILAHELKLKQALNLDGGSSTQLYAKMGSYEKEITGFNSVANGIVILPR
jgi:uncharacterized protein YigE (DUF2233 family)